MPETSEIQPIVEEQSINRLDRTLDFRITKAPKGETGWHHEFYASTGQMDRYGESIEPKAFRATLDQYVKTNPVILFAHNHRNLPVGKTVWATVNDKGLKVRILWAPTDLGNEIKMLYDLGFMHTLSVGFIPLKHKDATPEERKNGAPWRTYTAVDLLEISAVPVPANPGAVIQNSAEVRDFQNSLLLAEASDFQVEMVRSLYQAVAKLEPQKIVATRYKACEQKTDDNATWNEARERRRADPLQLVEMAAVIQQEADGSFKAREIHHTASGDVSRKACVAIITHLNDTDCPYDDEIRKEIYEHIRQHLVDDFGVAPEHVAGLIKRDIDPVEDDVPNKNNAETLQVELSPELKTAFEGLTTLIKSVETKLSDIDTRLKAVESRPAVPPVVEPKAGDKTETTPTPVEDDVIVLDFDKDEMNGMVEGLADTIAQRIFGAPPRKKK